MDAEKKIYSIAELQEILKLHAMWVRDENGGARADLTGAILTGVDLTGVPFIKDIHKVIYAAVSQPGALDMSKWHECETTHCRAGWVVTLAGDAGAALEFCIGTATAAALIYAKSDPNLERIPDFYCGNETALADMKPLAEAA